MRVYFDTSAILPLVLPEVHSEAVRRAWPDFSERRAWSWLVVEAEAALFPVVRVIHPRTRCGLTASNARNPYATPTTPDIQYALIPRCRGINPSDYVAASRRPARIPGPLRPGRRQTRLNLPAAATG